MPILLAVSISLTLNPSSISVLADPFGIFSYDNPTVVKLQGLRAHLFEAHDSTHDANASEIVMHLKMADEEISHFLQNLTTGNLSQTQGSNLSNTLSNVQMQLINTSSIADIGNTTDIMLKLKQADQHLVKSLEEIGYSDNKNLTPK